VPVFWSFCINWKLDCNQDNNHPKSLPERLLSEWNRETMKWKPLTALISHLLCTTAQPYSMLRHHMKGLTTYVHHSVLSSWDNISRSWLLRHINMLPPCPRAHFYIMQESSLIHCSTSLRSSVSSCKFQFPMSTSSLNKINERLWSECRSCSGSLSIFAIDRPSLFGILWMGLTTYKLLYKPSLCHWGLFVRLFVLFLNEQTERSRSKSHWLFWSVVH